MQTVLTVFSLLVLLIVSPSESHPRHGLSGREDDTEPTQVDRQLAFFDFEVLTQLALHAPGPLQQEMIDLAHANHLVVREDPTAPSLEDLAERRHQLHHKLRETFAIVGVDWRADSTHVRHELEPLPLAAGMTRTVLLEVHNQTETPISLWEKSATSAASTRYTVLPGRSQWIPAQLRHDAVGEHTVSATLASEAGRCHTFEIPVTVQPPATIRVTLHDPSSSQPAPGRVYVECSDHVYRHGGALAGNATLTRKPLLQLIDAGREYTLPFFYSDGKFEMNVPAGATTITLERGFEHEIATETLTLEAGQLRELTLTSGRLVDMRAMGWISGDTHVHWVTNQWNVDLPLSLLSTIQRAEDLRVANNLTLLHRTHEHAFINPSQAPMGPVEAFSDAYYHIEMGEEYRNENLYGHLCFLNLRWLVPPIGTGPQIAGDDSLDYPLNKTAIEACHAQGGISCEAHGLGGNKDVPTNVAHGLSDSLDQIEPAAYYDFLDCGFQLPLTNGSDHPARVVGSARAYVQVDGDFTYAKWIDGIRNGRTFTTSGPLLFLSVNDAQIGDALATAPHTELTIKAEAVSRRPLGTLQLISNGEVLKELTTTKHRASLALTMPAGESRWVVARCSSDEGYNAIHGRDIAHTSAIFIDVNGKRRFSETAARHWISRLQQHIRDIYLKGQFADDSQRQEAVEYVQAGVERYEELIAAHEPAADWPTVQQVDAQPLLLQVERLREALDYIGNPLSAEQKARLDALADEEDDERIVQQIQQILDPLCIAAVEISDGALNSVGQAGPHRLVEQGWRSFLVKVANRAGHTSRLNVESPNARSLPHAKQQDVDDRWLSLAMFDGRPLQTNLSGLGLEYRIVQLYSRNVGKRQATLEFSVDLKSDEPGRHIREWRFDQGSDGWEATNQATLEAREGSLYVTGEGLDPFITAPVGNATGDLLLRFRAETEQDGVAQIFWWTEERPEPDAGRCVTVPLIPRGNHRYEVTLPVEGVLAGVRIDPNVKPSVTRFDWIDLLHARRRGANWNSVALDFDAQASTPVTLKITDKPGEPAAAAFEIRDELGRVCPEQTKRLAPDMFFHPQIYRLDGETINLPPGTYSFRMWRGPHSLPETRQVIVTDQPQTVEYDVQRWFDPTEYGWWSGDHHIHSAGCLHYVNPTEGVLPGDMLRQTMGEDLNIGCCLTWGPCFDYQKQFFTGEVDKVSRYPYLLRYDVEVSGFGSHASGHLNLLRLKEQIYPGGDSKHHWPTLGLNTLRWAKQQGAICGPAHSANGLTNYAGRLEGYEDGPEGLPHFNIPRFDGIGACEYVVDVTHDVPGPDGTPVPAIDFISTMDTPRHDELNMWYHTLNCGFRVRASGETDFPCMSGERVGIGRSYVKVPGRLTFEEWVQGIQDGRSYVSDGTAHLIDFEARLQGSDDRFLPVGTSNSELSSDGPTHIECRAICAARLEPTPPAEEPHTTARVELIVNGYPVAEQTIPADGSPHEVRLSAPIEQSSWVALRVFPHAHTNPFFVVIDGAPIRPSKASAEWCLRSVEQCWQEKQPTYAAEEQADARQAYDHARAAYRAILKEAHE